MFRNYFKIAVRSLLKQRVYSIINVTGLAVGVASCLLIALFVFDEFSYDNFHEKGDRIYKVTLERIYPNHSTNYAVIPHSYAPVMKRDIPEVEDAIRTGGPFNDVLVDYRTESGERKQFEEDYVMAAEGNFFDIFSIKMLKGNPKEALTNVTDLVMTEATAKRYFGAAEPIGKTVDFFGQSFTVKGVCENIPENSHFTFDLLVKWDEQFFGGRQENFTSFSAHTYLLLRPGVDARVVEDKFPKLVDTYAAAQIERDLGKSWADYKKEGNGYRYFLQNVASIHLDPTNIEYKPKPVGGNINQVYFLICVAILIVLIASINFMNLATARSAERAREVGIRKTMGSLKPQLIGQFLTESVLISLVSTFIAIVIVQLLLPAFNTLADKNLSLTFSPEIIGALLGLAIIVGLMAGSYPAFMLSAFNPAVVIKGNFGGSSKGAWLRSGLVIFQFWISIVLIVGTLVVADQMEFVRNMKLGYDKDHLLVIERAFTLRDRQKTFQDELLTIPGITKVGGSSALFGNERDMFGSQFQPEGSTEILTTKQMGIDDSFANTIGFEFVDGKGFSEETNDSLSIILNETAVKTMELGSNPVGSKLTQVQRRQDGNVTVTYTVVGVIKDFNFQSLRDHITPLTIQSSEGFGRNTQYVYAKVNSNDMPAVIAAVKAKWDNVVSITRREGEAAEQPFKYTFLDTNLMANYEAEQRAGTLFNVFSTIAVVIACVGLFGLAAYTASLRTKEIGVRKVMGASVTSVIILLTRDFTKLILIAFVFAVPLGWYIMNNWLESFAYRTTLGIGTFLLAGGLALLISWITVSYQSIKAAVKNPVNSLRSE
jgi:putative ABC transport system permease protein